MGYIYQLTNLINDKFYIGSTIRPLYIRKYEHLSELRNNEHCNTYLQRSFNKYGEQNFSFKILETLKFPSTYSQLHKVEYLVCRELYLVDFLNAEYNIRKDTSTGKTGYVHSLETRRKISESNTTKTPSKRTLEKRDREIRRAEGKLYNKSRKGIGGKKGWKHSSKSIEKLREIGSREDNRSRMRELQKTTAENRIGTTQPECMKEKLMITKYGKMRPIEIYSKTGEILHTCNFSKEASIFTGVKRATIANNLVGLSKSAGNYIFTYKEISQ